MTRILDTTRDHQIDDNSLVDEELDEVRDDLDGDEEDDEAKLLAAEAEDDEPSAKHSVVGAKYTQKYAERAANMHRKPKGVPKMALKRPCASDSRSRAMTVFAGKEGANLAFTACGVCRN